MPMKQNAITKLNYSLLTYYAKLSKRTILNYFETIKFFIFKKNVKVVYFSVPSEVLYAYLKYDIIKTVSHKINNNNRHTAKLGWLINTLRTEPLINPVQLLPSGTRYFCHPGTDRVLVTCYILPKETISGFYIWYPDIDSHPFILDYEYEVINNPFKFLSKFKFNPFFHIKAETLKLSQPEKYTKGIFKTAVKHLTKRTNEDVYFLTFMDEEHWTKISLNVEDVLTFDTLNHCIFGGVGFTNINDTWIVDEYR